MRRQWLQKLFSPNVAYKSKQFYQYQQNKGHPRRMHFRFRVQGSTHVSCRRRARGLPPSYSRGSDRKLSPRSAGQAVRYHRIHPSLQHCIVSAVGVHQERSHEFSQLVLHFLTSRKQTCVKLTLKINKKINILVKDFTDFSYL